MTRILSLIVLVVVLLGGPVAAQSSGRFLDASFLETSLGPVEIVQPIETDGDPQTREWLVWGIAKEAYVVVAERHVACVSDLFHPNGIGPSFAARQKLPVWRVGGVDALVVQAPPTAQLFMLDTPACQ